MYSIETAPGKLSARPAGSGMINATDAVSVTPSKDIPIIRLKEYELLSSSVITQAAYSAAVAIEGLEAAKKMIPEGFLKYVKELSAKINIPEGGDPYDGLYPTTATGFVYKLPFYNDGEAFSKVSGFDEAYSGDGMNDFTRDLYESFKDISSKTNNVLGTLTEPGVFLLKPKFYNPSSSAQSVTFSFPLLNTISEKIMERNYDLCWLLLFQNSVRLIDRGAYIPPCIYEVTVPGYTYMKFGYVQSIGLSFEGTRRMKTIGGKKTIVPEAYRISMTLSQLTTDDSKFFDQA